MAPLLLHLRVANVELARSAACCTAKSSRLGNAPVGPLDPLLVGDPPGHMQSLLSGDEHPRAVLRMLAGNRNRSETAETSHLGRIEGALGEVESSEDDLEADADP